MWYPKERADLKMMHDENDVLTDDELVVVRGILRKSKHAFLLHACTHFKTNFLVDFVLDKNGGRREKINNTRKTP